MPPIYTKKFQVLPTQTDAFHRLKPSQILSFLQDAAGDHSALLGTGQRVLAKKNLFWAVLRHRVQITRLPTEGEEITVETWPMPTTPTAYPRSAVVYDAKGQELFRSISLWVLMDTNQRGLVLPRKSGIAVEGLLRGSELAVPGALMLKTMQNTQQRQIYYTDLDCNGHMNNCRYLDWAMDTLPAAFHKDHPVAEFSVRYHAEAKEHDRLHIAWELSEQGALLIDAQRNENNGAEENCRIFTVQMQF